jgi:GNAT superfamily N-acetyltransferase
MNHTIAVESIGYLASVLIAVSIMMTSVLRLRIFNMAGATVFSIYGYLIGSPPVALLNGFLALVNVWFIWRMLGTKAYFQLLPLQPESDYLRYFLDFYRKEIAAILPDFEYKPCPEQITLFVLRNCKPVGVFIARRKSEGVVRVVLDFVIPNYRDLRLGRFLFLEQADFFRERGVREIVVTPRTKDYGPFLAKVGFRPSRRSEGELHIHYENAEG